jgi:DNA-binding transcriptional LysR family regulator
MDFDQLTTFSEIAKQGSFSRAGQKLFRSQPAVSAQIRQLELEYGAKLFDRVGKSVRLTSAGETLYEYVHKMLTVRDESRRAVADQASTPRGVLSVGANEATCLYLLPEVFAEYHAQFPAVQISIYRNFSHKVLQKVEDGSVDVGIVTLPVKSPSLKTYPYFSRPRGLDGRSQQPARQSQDRQDQRNRRAAAHFSQDRLYSPDAR